MLSLLLFTVVAPAMMVQAATTPVFATLSGPTLVATNEVHQYQIVAIGGPGEGTGGNYSFQLVLSGSSKTDGKVLPDTGGSRDGKFYVNVTASSFAEDLTLSVKVGSYNGTSSNNITKTMIIKVVKPIVITAKVVNQGNATLTGVPVAFYVDDVKLYNTTITLSSKTTKTLVYNWTSQTVRNGEHSVRVELDPNNQFVRFSSGGTIFAQNIWVGPNDSSGSDGVLIGLFVLVLLMTYFVYKRPAKRRKK
jgi:hypothetical protein